MAAKTATKPPAPAKPAPVAADIEAGRIPRAVLAATSAKATVPRFGGLRGGRRRADGLTPGSAEAIEADRKKDAERKQITRANERLQSPPPVIPSAAYVPPPPPAAVAPGTGAPYLQPASPYYDGPKPPVPWEAHMLADFCDNLIEAAENWDVGTLVALAKKCGLPGEVCEEIEKDAAWKEITIKNLRDALPALIAKWLNAFGISAEYRFELMVGSAAVAIVGNHMILRRRIVTLARERGTLPAPGRPAKQPEPPAKTEEVKK